MGWRGLYLYPDSATTAYQFHLHLHLPPSSTSDLGCLSDPDTAYVLAFNVNIIGNNTHIGHFSTYPARSVFFCLLDFGVSKMAKTVNNLDVVSFWDDGIAKLFVSLQHRTLGRRILSSSILRKCRRVYLFCVCMCVFPPFFLFTPGKYILTGGSVA